MTERRDIRWEGLGLVLWAALVGGAALVGRSIYAHDPDTPTRAAPFFGRYQLDLEWGVARPVVLGLLLVIVWPWACRTLRLRFLLPLSAAVSTLWAAVVATTQGLHDLTAPIGNRHDYLPAVRQVGSPAAFLDTFLDNYDSFTIHVQGHPPLAVTVFWAMEQLGLSGEGWATALVLLIASAAAPSVIYIAASLGGISTARRVAIFAGLAPGVLTIASSVDAAIMGVVALTAAVATGALVTHSSRRSAALGFLCGLLAATALYLSYGAPLLLASSVPLGILLLKERRSTTVGAMVVGVVLVGLVFTLNGFWILDGLDTTRQAYREGISDRRPYSLFIWLNLAAILAMVGPTPLAGALKAVARWRTNRMWPNRFSLVVVAAAVGVLAANLSGLSKGEVERIWLPFVPFLAAAGAPVARTSTGARVGLSLQLAVAVGLEAIWRSPW